MQAPARISEGFPGERLVILPPEVITRARRMPVSRDLCVTHTGRFDGVRGHYVDRPRGRPEHVLILCLAGQGSVRLRHSTYRLQSGGGIVLPPRQAHRYAADTNAPWTVVWFHFVGQRAAQYVAALGVDARRPAFWVHAVDTVAAAFEDCYRHTCGGYSDAELFGLNTAFARLLGLCRTLQRSQNPGTRRTEEQMTAALQYMRENLTRPLKLAALARVCSLSVLHFSAVFRERMNCPPIEFVIRLKLQRACELLLTTTLDVGEIAAAVGYDDPLYFSRLFRQKIGIPPRAYRRSGQRESTEVRPR